MTENTTQADEAFSHLTAELEANKRHWYCFSYVGKAVDTNDTVNACTYTGFSKQEVTLADIKENKANAGVTDKAVLMGLSYCGFMTKKQFTEGF